MKREKPIVAIDGPVGVGKSSVASSLAKRLSFLYIDTGAMYRTVTLMALRDGLNLDDCDAVAALAEKTDIRLERSAGKLKVFSGTEEVTEDIRSPEVSAATSAVADNPQVRQHLVALQQEMGENGGVVMEGRDITTVVFPDAEIQIYLDADPKIRAERRFKELQAKGKDVTFEKTLADLMERDKRDKARPVGALTVSDNAIVLDTTQLNQDQVINNLSDIVTDYMTNN
jgi:CMP/dCMP kinase